MISILFRGSRASSCNGASLRAFMIPDQICRHSSGLCRVCTLVPNSFPLLPDPWKLVSVASEIAILGMTEEKEGRKSGRLSLTPNGSESE